MYFNGYAHLTDSGRPLPNKPLRVVVTDESVRAWDGSNFVYELPMVSVTAVQVSDGTVFARETPQWAIVVGIIGLLVFCIGFLFFFVKQDVPKPGTMLSLLTDDGRRVTVRVSEPFGIGQARWWPLVQAKR